MTSNPVTVTVVQYNWLIELSPIDTDSYVREMTTFQMEIM